MHCVIRGRKAQTQILFEFCAGSGHFVKRFGDTKAAPMDPTGIIADPFNQL
jgi:hypothetical protein